MLFIIMLLKLFGITTEGKISQHIWNHNVSLNENSIHKTPSICKEMANCSCYKYGNYISITCIRLNDIDQLLHFLKVRFGNSKIRHVYISRSVIDHLPPKSFQGLFITKISIQTSIVSNVSEDAFSGIIGLADLRLHNLTCSAIPNSVGKLNSTLRELWMVQGDLVSIKTSLQNCTKMQVLSFKENKIAHIDHSAFLYMNNLLQLDLSNNSIIWLDPRTFNSFGQLEELDLTGNQLRSTDGFFNKNQFTIQRIKLGGNNISDISKMTVNPLTSLKLLVLSENPLAVIEIDSFRNVPALQTLDLRNCLLKSIAPGSLQFTNHLLHLDISYNQLSYLDQNIFANIRGVHYLYISGNRLRSLNGLFQYLERVRVVDADRNSVNIINPQSFNNAKLLRELFLSGNSLTRVQKDTFINNGYLKHLQLARNRINSLESNAFRGLYELQYLSLSHNRLSTLNDSITNLPELTTLDLNNNYLTVLDASCFLNGQNIHTLNVSYNSLKSVEGAFFGMRNLQELQLQNNYLEVLTEQSFSSPEKLKKLYISGNPLTCNCLLKWMVELIANKSITIDDAQCRSPEWMENKLLKNISTEDITYWPEDCPQECNCICSANFTDYYIGVNCDGLGLTTTPEILPNKTGYLDLSNNRIDRVPQSMFHNLTQLEFLYLHQNNFTLIPDVSSFALRNLTLANNYITRFPVSNVDSTYLERVTLSENPWICDCQTLDFRKWLLTNKIVVSDVNDTKCGDSEVNGRLRNRAIISLSEFTLCSYLIVIYASICIGILVFLLFIVSGKITYNRYRMNIKIWMYTRGICSCLSCVKEEDLDEDKEFDAFISYSSEDETFVVRTLVPMMESGDKPYLLCLHYRQFPPGSFIQDSIMQAVKISKRTILVLSKNFLQSEWCRLEFKSAHHQVLEERLNRLIVIILGELPSKEEIDPEIMMYLESTTYLTWGEKNFWNKLKYVMPKTPCEVTEEEKSKLLENEFILL